MEHPAEDALLRFLVGASSRQENRQIVRHLLSRCPTCAQALRRLRPDPPVDPGAYDQALDRLAECLSANGRNFAAPPPRPAPRPILSTL